MKKYGICIFMMACMLFCTACSVGKEAKPAEVNVFVAASLHGAMSEIAENYEKAHPGTKLVLSADSSGKLLAKIQEGAPCDIFFSADRKQVEALKKEGRILDGREQNLLRNQLAVICRKDADTLVTGIENIENAKSLALADGSVPVGKYTRVALKKLGKLQGEVPSKISTQEVSAALGNVEISEQSNVSKVVLAVLEKSAEIGTVYTSDITGHEEELRVLEKVSDTLTGSILYPVSRVENKDAAKEEMQAADDFYQYLMTDEAKAVFEKYGFSTDLK